MNNRTDVYANIDMKRSGQKMKQMILEAGYDVKAIQNYLHLAYPQPVYRWFHGQVLPTVDHLFMLSKLLGVHMEEFLVEAEEESDLDKNSHFAYKRLLLYYKLIAHS